MRDKHTPTHSLPSPITSIMSTINVTAPLESTEPRRSKATRKVVEKVRLKSKRKVLADAKQDKQRKRRKKHSPSPNEVARRERNRNLYRQNKDAIKNYKDQDKLLQREIIGGRGGKGGGAKVKLNATRINLVNTNLVNPETLRMRLARFDYYMEEPLFAAGGAFYDMSDRSDVTVGDAHGFVHQNKRTNMVEFFIVTKVLAQGSRRDHWCIEAHANRNVVVLSKYIGWAPWDKTARLLGGFGSGPSQLPIMRGTTTREWNRDIEITMDGAFVKGCVAV